MAQRALARAGYTADLLNDPPAFTFGSGLSP
jgi:hypothetical protein